MNNPVRSAGQINNSQNQPRMGLIISQTVRFTHGYPDSYRDLVLLGHFYRTTIINNNISGAFPKKYDTFFKNNIPIEMDYRKTNYSTYTANISYRTISYDTYGVSGFVDYKYSDEQGFLIGNDSRATIPLRATPIPQQ